MVGIGYAIALGAFLCSSRRGERGKNLRFWYSDVFNMFLSLLYKRLFITLTIPGKLQLACYLKNVINQKLKQTLSTTQNYNVNLQFPDSWLSQTRLTRFFTLYFIVLFSLMILFQSKTKQKKINCNSINYVIFSPTSSITLSFLLQNKRKTIILQNC